MILVYDTLHYDQPKQASPRPTTLRPTASMGGGDRYVSVVSTFPNTFALVLDSNLHDLNETNPD